jgi:aspartyl-tRNA(Asn)/glutamyl-tRNA(Gln) amidotransferase subunit A
VRSAIANAGAGGAGLLPRSIREASALLRDGTLSAAELTERCLRRIAEHDPGLNAFITVTGELARKQAAVADRELRAGRWKGPLHGVPVAVKDFFDTARVRTTAAFAGFADRVPREDAEIVVKLREVGAILVGKTNMHQLGMGTTSLVSHFGPVVNPLSPEHVAGGSSGGSAAAVAAGLCFATIDSDAIGSARLPAACCGVTALKPTPGRLSAKGILAGEPADETIVLLAHTSVTARSPDDVALAFAALTGAGDATSPVASRSAGTHDRPTIGVVRNALGTARALRVLAEVVELLRSRGSAVRDVDVRFDAARFDATSIAEDRASFGDRLFSSADVLVLPTLADEIPTTSEARLRGEQAVSPANTFFCNYFGIPAVSVPFHAGEGALPVSLQFVGLPGGEQIVLGVAGEAASTRVAEA